MDPDPGGPKTCGSGGSGSGTLVTWIRMWSASRFTFSSGFFMYIHPNSCMKSLKNVIKRIEPRTLMWTLNVNDFSSNFFLAYFWSEFALIKCLLSKSHSYPQKNETLIFSIILLKWKRIWAELLSVASLLEYHGDHPCLLGWRWTG